MTHILKKDIHPNQSSYEVIAKLIAEAVWGNHNAAMIDMMKRRGIL